MVARERKLERGRRRARAALVSTGGELHEGRLGASLTQTELGDAVGISHSEVSRIERGIATRVPYETLAMMAAVLGMDLSLRTFPAGDPIRDAAQLVLLGKMRSFLPAGPLWQTEVPLAIPGDLRAWDAMIEGRGWRVAVEAETRLRDVQALLRRLALKQRDDRQAVVILLVADTRHNRHVLRLAAPELTSAFPLRGRAVLEALSKGEAPPASGIVLL